jgi:thymidylate synthase
MMFAQVSGLKAGELVHVIADAHLYDRHIPIVKEILKNPQYDAPVLKINPNVKNFYDFTVDDFELVDYKYTKLDKKIEVAI